MKTGNNGVNLIKKYEGLALKAYLCPANVWTIGYGHTKNVTPNMSITAEEATKLLQQDLKIYEDAVNRLNRTFTQNEFDALVSFTYNLGEGCLKTLTKNRNKEEIAEAILLYNKANGKILPGLVKRRNEERALFLSQEDNNSLPYSVETTDVLNIRKGPSTLSPILRTVPKGTVLTVWAIVTHNDLIWGKNGSEYFCLNYCQKL